MNSNSNPVAASRQSAANLLLPRQECGALPRRRYAGLRFTGALLLATASTLRAAEGGLDFHLGAAPATWHAQSLGQAIGYMLLFAAIGIAAAVIGYKVFDKCTPGDLNKEIIENKNVAAAIVAAAVILGVSIIIAAAMLG
jgi:putative membrane protein